MDGNYDFNDKSLDDLAEKIVFNDSDDFDGINPTLSEVDPYYQQKVNAVGNKGLSPLQKCTTAMSMLAYGVSADVVDDCTQIGESTAIECLEKFVEDVISAFECEFFCTSNSNDVQCFLKIGENRGFPNMKGNIDCMHWKWKDYPKVWKCMFLSDYCGVPTIVLETDVSSSDL
ncbi:uncharacterized protein LOC107615012 [Arachis ipaensis]|uniref:uncharacterized protein LOC107615012 n=1 Tax=Arachis ipaensis TaxID=130454 RepID=UPI0007AF6DA5|nr:uncharacterized protein LOC107615012 [Arachis ipaensis]XP_025678108.1 uncharacterized protein LOC112777944 [Arachis hypogaea]